jgi:hypothetical protein
MLFSPSCRSAGAFVARYCIAPLILALLSAIPVRAEERLAYHDTLALGFGFDPLTAKQHPSPLTSRKASRITTGDPVFNFELIQSESTSNQTNGSAMSLGVEARYMAYSGKASFSFEQAQESAKHDFSMGMKANYDWGDYRLTNLRLKPQALRFARYGYDEFVKHYGTHCVIGEARQTYVVVHYRVHRLSTKLEQKLGMTLDAEGSWGLGGGSINAQFKQALSQIASESAVEVKITASVKNVDVTRIVRSANDVDQVLDQIAALTTQLNSSEPRAREFVIEPWENLINFENPRPIAGRSDDPNWITQVSEWLKMKRLETRLLTYIEGASTFYSYLRPQWIRDPLTGEGPGVLNDALAGVRARKVAIEATLKSWKDGAPSFAQTFDPILVDWPAGYVEFEGIRQQSTDGLVIGFMGIRGHSKTFRHAYFRHVPTGAQVEIKDANGNLQRSIGLTGISYTNAFIRGTSFKPGEWEVVVINGQGQPVIVASIPVPY